MGNSQAIFILGTAVLFGCGSDNKAKPDAPVQHDAPVTHDSPTTIDAMVDAGLPAIDTSCHSKAVPATGNANDTIIVGGNEIVAGTGGLPANQADGSATVTLDLMAGSNAITDQGTTDGTTGAAVFPGVATGSLPLTGSITITKDGDRDAHLYLPAPVTGDLTAPAIVFTDGGLAALAGIFQATITAGDGNLIVIADDCAGSGVDASHAVLTATQGGSDVTGGGASVRTFGAQAPNTFLLTSVPPGDTVVNVTYGATTFLAVTVHVFADAETETIVRPGQF